MKMSSICEGLLQLYMEEWNVGALEGLVEVIDLGRRTT